MVDDPVLLRWPVGSARVGAASWEGSVHVRFDADGVVAATVRLESAADAARRLASAVAKLGGSHAGTVDAALVESLRVVGDVCGDILEVVGLDLDVLAAKARSGAQAYDEMERGVTSAVGHGLRAS